MSMYADSLAVVPQMSQAAGAQNRIAFLQPNFSLSSLAICCALSPSSSSSPRSEMADSLKLNADSSGRDKGALPNRDDWCDAAARRAAALALRRAFSLNGLKRECINENAIRPAY